MSTHDFDLIRWLAGQDIVEVYARGTNSGDPAIRAVGDVDTAQAVLTLADAYVAELVVLVELVRGERENPCMPFDAVAAFLVRNAAQLSRTRGEPVAVPALRLMVLRPRPLPALPGVRSGGSFIYPMKMHEPLSMGPFAPAQ